VLSYLAQVFVLSLVFMVLIFAVVAVFGMLAGVSNPADIESLDYSNPMVLVGLGIAGLLYICMIYCMVCMMIKRLHDRNHSGWWSLALLIGMLIPFVNIVAIIAALYVTFFPGHKTANRFGGRRVTKGWEKVLGILYILLIVVGIVAGIAGGAAMFMNAG